MLHLKAPSSVIVRFQNLKNATVTYSRLLHKPRSLFSTLIPFLSLLLRSSHGAGGSKEGQGPEGAEGLVFERRQHLRFVLSGLRS